MLRVGTLLFLAIGSVTLYHEAYSLQMALAQRRQEQESVKEISTAGGEVILVSYSLLDGLWIALLGDDPYMRIGVVIFQETRLTDDGMQRLAQQYLQRCEELSSVSICRENHLTGKGLSHLSRIPQLQEVRVCEVPLGDADLQELRDLKQVRMLTLKRTNVTTAGAKQLQKALPNCLILLE